MIVKTVSNPILPEKRISSEYIMGRDGSYKFEDGYKDKILVFDCTLIDKDLNNRRETIREIAKWLSNQGELVLDYENDKKYIVTQTVNNIELALLNKRDTFTVTFICKPQQYSKYFNNTYTWNNVIDGSSYSIYNHGTYKALPTIELVGTANSITLECNGNQFTYSNLNGSVTIDCENMVVYEGDKVNRIQNFNGDFLEFTEEQNVINATGDIIDVTINFKFDYAYI